jgi:hypothetical protein
VIEWWYPFLAWAAVFGAVVRGLQVLIGGRGPHWLPLLAAALVGIPVEGLPIARWLHGFHANLSIPLVTILWSSTLSPLCQRPWLDEQALRVGVWYGVVSGLCLYPMAGGWGSIDPYGLGWQRPGIELIVGGVSLILLWRGNAFGGVLLLSGLCWRLGCLESDNVWDYLIDPVYFVISLIGMMTPRQKRLAGADSGVSTKINAGSAVPQP